VNRGPLMTKPLSEQDLLKLARAADSVRSAMDEAERARSEGDRLGRADDATLLATLNDRASDPWARRTALMLLIRRGDPRRDGTLSRVMPTLWDDPDEILATMAIEHAPLDDPEVTDRLRALLDDPRSARWTTAASVLANRRKDATIIPRLIGWFRRGDREHRNVACSCLCFYGLVEPAERRGLLREAWDAGGRDDDDRTMLAVGLLGLGDRIGWEFLVELARRADCYSATWAAEMIMEQEPGLGLDLMLHILERGASFEVRWGMVEKVAQAAGLPHLWTADGLAEARNWVEQERLRLASGGKAVSLSALRMSAN
jgi:hypothetical protein